MRLPETIANARIIPVVHLEDAGDALPVCAALARGGVAVAEVTFRTAAAPEGIRRVATEMPEFCIGAGTVLSPESVQAAVDAGARFAVAPGFNSSVVNKACELGLPFGPGIITPTELEAAVAAGCQWLKVFPSAPIGGVPYLKTMLAPYAHLALTYTPTGGIREADVRGYLDLPNVAACGGSWLAPAEFIARKDWAAIEANARRAATFARPGPSTTD